MFERISDRMSVAIFSLFLTSSAFATDYKCASPEVLEKLRYVDVCSAADGTDYCAALGLKLSSSSDIQNFSDDNLATRCLNITLKTLSAGSDKPISDAQKKAWEFYCSLRAATLKEEDRTVRKFQSHETWYEPNSRGYTCVATGSINVGELPASAKMEPLTKPYDKNSEESAASVAFADIVNGSSTDWQLFEKLYRRYLYVAKTAAPFSNPTKDLEIPYTVEPDGNGSFRILKGQIREGSPPPKSNSKFDWQSKEPNTSAPSTISPPSTEPNTQSAISSNDRPQLSFATMPADGQDPNGLLAVLLKVTSNDERPFVIKKIIVNGRCPMSTNGNPVADLARALKCNKQGENTQECLSGADSPRTVRRGDVWAGVVMTITCGQPTTLDIETTIGRGHYTVEKGSSNAELRDCLASNPYSRRCPLDDEYCQEAEREQIFEQNCFSRFAN